MAPEPGERSPRLLVLGAGPGQLGFLEAARAHGVWTAVCDRNPAAPGFALADRRCIVSIEDETAIERLAAAFPLDGVISPAGDAPVAVAARVAERLGLPHPVSAATASLVASKLRQREALTAAGVPQPRWEIAVGESPTVEFEPPLVVKSADRTDRGGPTIVRRARDLAAAVEGARRLGRTGVVMVEELLEGDEVTVSGFSAAGEFVPLAVTDRLSAAEPAFGVALAHMWPSRYAEAAAEVARRAVEALGIDEGPSYTQLRLSRGGPEVIEVGAKLGGGHDAELVQLVSGIDLNGLGLAAALGRPIAASELKGAFREVVGGAAVRFLVAPPGSLEGVEVPQGGNGVVSTRVYHDAGHVFGPLRRAADRAGAVLAVGASREEAEARVDAAVERIRFVTADAEAIV
jgi:biotin carboxylase